ncbi:hypothetical protein OS242_21000 [Tumebacillus sp. DT12]|uniref:LXG domain-containing protein n=1 Tax=Tumebacillus lacus TaxID=2995335 RepID=A0ABT3X9P9_9BACL|nr:hypothetical protein [Tumebacillus lacus]MCX7572391.1 hypothetical protein [Tumebacillus lacus]
MRYPYANTYLIRSGAQRFSFAAMEMRQSAQKIESLTYSVHDGASGWQGAGYEAFQSVAGNLKGDTLTSSHAFEQVASALSSLAGSYDGINRMYQQVEQMDQEIHSLEGQLYYADEERRDALRDSLSHVRYRRRALLQEAEREEHQANARAAAAFDEAGAMANRMYFDAGAVFAMQATQAARQVKEFFGDMKDKAGQVFRQVLPEEFRDFAEDLRRGFCIISRWNWPTRCMNRFRRGGRSLIRWVC